MEELKCPHCGSLNVDYGDCYDTEITFDHQRENDIVIRKMNGYCGDCGADDLLWEEIYEFVGVRNVTSNSQDKGFCLSTQY